MTFLDILLLAGIGLLLFLALRKAKKSGGCSCGGNCGSCGGCGAKKNK